MKILITNDDGIDAEGIQILALQLFKDGFDVTIVAPKEDSSGAGAGVGQVYLNTNSIRYDKVSIPGLEDIEAYSIDALPAMTVLAGFLGFLEFLPDIVISGINNGLNVGRSSLHSGTVGAALTSQHFCVPSIAVSTEWDERPIFESAATITCELIRAINAGTFNLAQKKITLNLNVPSKPLDAIKGVKITKLSNYGLIKAVNRNSDTNTLNLDLTPHDFDHNDETDIAALRSGYASVTPIETVKHSNHEGLITNINNIIQPVWDRSIMK